MALAQVSGAHADTSVWQLPGDLAEWRQASAGRSGLETFAQSGYLAVECGYQAILLGSQLPIAPAAHVPWARPYARGPIKLLIVTTFGHALTDVEELAQVTRALDVDVRWLLVAELAVTSTEFSDELYRTRYLDAQARAVLREDYDAILMTFGTLRPWYGAPQAHAYFTDEIYRVILEKVSRGTGLLLVSQLAGNRWWVDRTPLAAVLPARMTGEHFELYASDARIEAARQSAVFAGIDYDAPWFTPTDPMTLYGWRLAPDAQVLASVSGRPAVMAREHGKGRVVLLGWGGTLGPQRSAGRMELEHNMALALRAIAYAARREPQVQLELSDAPIAAGAPSQLHVTVSKEARLEVSVRDETFRTLHAVAAPAGQRSRTIGLPSLPKGSYFVEAIAKDPQGRVLTWGDKRLNVRAPFELNVETDKQTYRLGETVQIAGRCSGLAPDAALRATLEVRDATGRVLARESRAFGAEMHFEYAIRAARVAPHEATIEIARSGAALLRATGQFYVPSSRWEDYENVLWPARPESELNETLRDEGGFTAVFDAGGRDAASSIGARYGLRPARMNVAVLEPALVQTQPVRAAAAPLVTLKPAIEVAERYGALTWVFQDERAQLGDPGMPDVEGLSRFREYLRARYASLTALNNSWGTSYAAWDRVQPTLTSDVQAGVKNLAPWVDFRLYAADQAFGLDARHARMVRDALGSDAVVGLDGFTSSHVLPYGGLDFGRLAAEGVFNFYAPYADDLLFASLIKGPKAKYLGWSMRRAEYFGAPWRDAFRGYWGTFRFFGPTFWSEFGFLQPAGRWTGESTRELRAGVGKLLIGSERELSPVAILYSYPSLVTMNGTKFWEARHGGAELAAAATQSRAVLEQMLLGAGVSFGYQTDAQVARGSLAGKKLLILPREMSVALSKTTTRAIDKFVRDGGTVLADLSPGLCDEHGKPRTTGALDALFGVRSSGESIIHAARDYGATVLGKHALVPRGEWLFDEWYDRGLQVTDGWSTGQHVSDGAPAFVIKQRGRGRTLLLNLLLASVRPDKPTAGGEQHALMRRVLDVSKITPLARVETTTGLPQTHCEVNRFRDQDNTYVGVYAHGDAEGDAELVRLRFDDEKETYDLRAGRYLGRTRELPLPLHEREATLLARLDYKLTTLELAAPRTAARGELLRIAIALGATARPGRHVVHVQVSEPSGAVLPLYTQNVTIEGGHGELQLYPALNEPAGLWHISAREIVSGLEADARFELE